MHVQRRALLAVASTLALTGCLLHENVDEDPRIRLVNLDSDPHYLATEYRGSDDEAAVHEITAYLEASEDERACQQLSGAFEGRELIVRTRVDHGEPREHAVQWGFTDLSVVLQEDGTISFSTGTT